jgi:anti-anti-sigma regulatory factor
MVGTTDTNTSTNEHTRNSAGLTVTVDDTDRRRRLRLAGVLDMSTVSVALDVIDHEQSRGNPEVWLDLDEITYVDDGVLAEFARAHRRLYEHGAWLVVTGLHRQALH